MESCWNADPRLRPDARSLDANLSEKLIEEPSVSTRGVDACAAFLRFVS